MLDTQMRLAAILIVACAAAQPSSATDKPWTNPIQKRGYLNSPLVETTPFVFKGQLYLLEFWRSGWDWPDVPGEGKAAAESQAWVAHLPQGPERYDRRKYIAPVWDRRTLGTAIVDGDRVYVFAVDERSGRTRVDMTWSDDLKVWSKPVTVLTSPHKQVFNVAVTRDTDGFAFLWETNGVGRPFTMCFGRIESLDDRWNDGIIEGAVYGAGKYTGGPALYFADGWYYLLYLEALGGYRFETRLARSRDLKNWLDAQPGRAFLPFNPQHVGLPLHAPDDHETNASDAELCAYDGRTIIFFTGGRQTRAGDLQWAEYDGTAAQLFEHFFKD